MNNHAFALQRTVSKSSNVAGEERYVLKLNRDYDHAKIISIFFSLSKEFSTWVNPVSQITHKVFFIEGMRVPSPVRDIETRLELEMGIPILQSTLFGTKCKCDKCGDRLPLEYYQMVAPKSASGGMNFVEFWLPFVHCSTCNRGFLLSEKNIKEITINNDSIGE